MAVITGEQRIAALRAVTLKTALRAWADSGVIMARGLTAKRMLDIAGDYGWERTGKRATKAEAYACADYLQQASIDLLK